MHKVIDCLRRKNVYIAGLLAVAVLFSACNKNEQQQVVIEKAVVMVSNLAPDLTSVLAEVGGKRLTDAPMPYPSSTSAYLDVELGLQNVQCFNYPATTPFASSAFTFEQNRAYSLFILGAAGTYGTLIANDSVDADQLASAKAYVRFINAIPGTTVQPNIKVFTNTSTVFDETAVPFPTITDFKAIDYGTINVTVNNGDDVDVTKQLTLYNSMAYTIIISGLPDATDDEKKVQIKIVENGFVRSGD